MGKCIYCGNETPLIVNGVRICWFCHAGLRNHTTHGQAKNLPVSPAVEHVAAILKEAGFTVRVLTADDPN
jgi:hypothetical protein